MNQFNKPTCQKLRTDLNTLLADFGKKNGITFELGNMKFYAEEAHFTRVTVRINGAKKMTEKALDNQFAIHGLRQTNDAGDRLIEYSRRRHQYPFVYETRLGKRYKCSLQQAIRKGFGQTATK